MDPDELPPASFLDEIIADVEQYKETYEILRPGDINPVAVIIPYPLYVRLSTDRESRYRIVKRGP